MRKVVVRQQIRIGMMPLLDHQVLSVWRWRSPLDDSLLAHRFHRPVEPHHLRLRRRVVIEDPLVLRTLDQILIRPTRRDPPQVLLYHWPVWSFTSLRNRASVLYHRLADQTLAVARPFARRS